MQKASKATFTNDFIRRCLAADLSKNPYLNNLTTGTAREGEIISLSAIGKEYPVYVQMFREALKEGRDYRSPRVAFRGYEMTMETKTQDNGDKRGWLSLEYVGCGNGHYYDLINDEEFIYTDKD